MGDGGVLDVWIGFSSFPVDAGIDGTRSQPEISAFPAAAAVDVVTPGTNRRAKRR